jgi:hypothetical protein
MTLGILEFVRAVGIIFPTALHRQPPLAILAATILAIESLVFSACTSSTATSRPRSCVNSRCCGRRNHLLCKALHLLQLWAHLQQQQIQPHGSKFFNSRAHLFGRTHQAGA